MVGVSEFHEIIPFSIFLSTCQKSPGFVIGFGTGPERKGVLVDQHAVVKRDYDFVVIAVELEGSTDFSGDAVGTPSNYPVDLVGAPILGHTASVGIVERKP